MDSREPNSIAMPLECGHLCPERVSVSVCEIWEQYWPIKEGGGEDPRSLSLSSRGKVARPVDKVPKGTRWRPGMFRASQWRMFRRSEIHQHSMIISDREQKFSCAFIFSACSLVTATKKQMFGCVRWDDNSFDWPVHCWCERQKERAGAKG